MTHTLVVVDLCVRVADRCGPGPVNNNGNGTASGSFLLCVWCKGVKECEMMCCLCAWFGWSLWCKRFTSAVVSPHCLPDDGLGRHHHIPRLRPTPAGGWCVHTIGTPRSNCVIYSFVCFLSLHCSGGTIYRTCVYCLAAVGHPKQIGLWSAQVCQNSTW